METIDFNQVIKDNISVVGGLLPIATTQSKGLMSAYDKYGQYSITKAETALTTNMGNIALQRQKLQTISAYYCVL